MGLGGISIWQLLIILAIVVVLFGTKRLKNIGSDLGNAVKGFRSAMSSGEKDGEDSEGEPKQIEQEPAQRVADRDAAASKPVAQDRPKV
jgi:sec-independent protein translocase protein TatA